MQVVLVAMVKVADNVTSALPADRCIGGVCGRLNSGNPNPENAFILCQLPTSLYAGRHAGDVFSRGLSRAFQPRFADITPGVAVAAELAAMDEEPFSPVVRSPVIEPLRKYGAGGCVCYFRVSGRESVSVLGMSLAPALLSHIPA